MSAATSWVAHCVRESTNSTRPHSAFSGRMWSSSSDAAATWAVMRRAAAALSRRELRAALNTFAKQVAHRAGEATCAIVAVRS